ncbi:hypothetical protein ACHAWF_016790, partial [Thalassiosira exigua]
RRPVGRPPVPRPVDVDRSTPSGQRLPATRDAPAEAEGGPSRSSWERGVPKGPKLKDLTIGSDRRTLPRRSISFAARSAGAQRASIMGAADASSSGGGGRRKPSSPDKPSGRTSAPREYYRPPGASVGGGGTASDRAGPGGARGDVGGDGAPRLVPSSRVRLLHQRTSLSLAYDRDRGWGCRGETALYCVLDPDDGGGASKAQEAGSGEGGSGGGGSSGGASRGGLGGDGRPLELALHLRDSCRVESVAAFAAAVEEVVPEEEDGVEGEGGDAEEAEGRGDAEATAIAIASLRPLPRHEVSFRHHDPLSVFLARPAKLHSVEEDGNVHFDGAGGNGGNGDDEGTGGKSGTVRRCEADAHAARGTKGMTHSLRAASVSSAAGELRIRIAPSVEGRADEGEGDGGGKGTKGGAEGRTTRPRRGSAGASGGSSGNDAPNDPAAAAGGSERRVADRAAPPRSEDEAVRCWKDDLSFDAPSSSSRDADGAPSRRPRRRGRSSAGEAPPGALERKARRDMVRWRCEARREARLEAVARALARADGAEGTKEGWPLSPAMKVVVRFSLREASGGGDGAPPRRRLDLGGISFLSPPSDPPPGSASLSAPHCHTVAGTHGDHQGVRSWLPTLDSASPRHRASHELVVKVTARAEEGLWACGSGEDFGTERATRHPVLGNDAEEVVFGPMIKDAEGGDATRGVEGWDDEAYRRGLERARRAWEFVDRSVADALGRRHARFANDFFFGTASDEGDETDGRQPSGTPERAAALDASDLDPGMLAAFRRMGPAYVTSVFSSFAWSPCPSRSLGFAVGPFASLYDPEYFRLDDDEDDSDAEAEEIEAAEMGGEDAFPPLSLEETAKRSGEGVRQVYFAPADERRWIHADVDDEAAFGPEPPGRRRRARPRRPEPSAARQRELRTLERTVLASTVGVPNRALSLVRDVLALPAYRTASYTQVWIPDARLSGSSSGGNLAGRPEAGGCNPFLGGAILDGALLPPPGMRLPYYDEGRSLQFLQARSAVRGWVRAALPLGSDDDVGQGYLHSLVEEFLMSLYERGHGAFGEGGGRGSFFYTKRYAIGSGLNSPNLDFLPLANIEEDEVVVGGGLGAIAIEEPGNEHLWRSANNGTETHTSSLDEFAIGQLLAKDFVEAMERTDKAVPLPSMGWSGSFQSASFLSHNSASSTSLGCGALDLVHPMGGQTYRAAKAVLLNRVYEGRASVSHYARVVRAAFIASFLRDSGVSQLTLPEEEKGDGGGGSEKDVPPALLRPPFVVCIDEIIKKQALSHAIFTRALRVMSGPIHEAVLRGNLVDIDRNNYDSRFERKIVSPEGFPNSYVRGASGLYLRVGTHIEAADGSATGQSTTSAASQSAAAVKGIHLHVVAEPVIPEGGSAFGGPVTLRVVENEGQYREFVKNVPSDGKFSTGLLVDFDRQIQKVTPSFSLRSSSVGSRVDWGPIFLHARPVSTAKQQQAASGISDAPATTAAGTAAASGVTASGAVVGGNNASGTAFTSDHLHRGGFQALELIRITNTTPLLWVRVDPHGLYNGRLSIFQQDACLAEQLFHDGDAVAQVEAMRTLAERPLKIQGTHKINRVQDVPIAELPVRVLGDCLRGSVALHCDLPHNPAVRAQAALAIAQWQNNKAPESKDVVGGSAWLGLDLLMQYFRERFMCNGVVLPVNFRRCVLHRHIVGGASGGDTTSDGGYQYLDALTEKEDRANAIEFADEVEIEEDEEYRVRSACVTAIASIRAQDGMTPKPVLTFLEEVLISGDKAAIGSLLLPNEEEQLKKKQDQALNDEVAHNRRIIGPNDDDVSNLPYASLSLVADALLALCYVNVQPQSDFDPTSGGRVINSKAEDHPILALMESCLGWLEWDLERTRLRAEANRANLTGVGDACHSTIAPCAITALCHMALLKQSTTLIPAGDKDSSTTDRADGGHSFGVKRKPEEIEMDKTSTAQFYIDIFDDKLVKADSVRAAAAQSVVCICCAADRNEAVKKDPLGLLVSLEFLLDRLLEPMTSSGLRLTLALLMMDACTGKVCSLQRVGSFCGQNRLVTSGSRFMNGPLGASCGGDNGSALLMTVSESTYPAANAVNDGAR